jgi:opacity protein-like surface antigen
MEESIMRQRSLALLLGILCCAVPALAAEVPAWDLSASAFVGVALPQSTDVSVSGATARDVDLSNAVSFGGKLTAWTTELRPRLLVDLGLQFDVTQSFPEVKPQTFVVTGLPGVVAARLTEPLKLSNTLVAVNLLARVPVGVTADLPAGRVAPYVGGGVGTQTARAKLAGNSDTDTAVAFQGLAGLSVALTRHLALFGEYKYTHAKHQFDLAPGFRVDTTLAAHHLVGGITVHF